MRTLLASIGLIALTGMSYATEASYKCDDGASLQADFSAPGSAGSVRLAISGQKTITLPQVQSADGGRYATQEVEFWIKGTTGRLTRAGKTTECRTP